MRGQGTPFELQRWPAVYAQYHFATHFSLVIAGSLDTIGRAQAPQLYAGARRARGLDADLGRMGARGERRDGEVMLIGAIWLDMRVKKGANTKWIHVFSYAVGRLDEQDTSQDPIRTLQR